MSRSLRTFAVVLLAAAAAAFAAAARAEVVQTGGVRVAIDGDLTPKALPRTGTAPIGVSLSGNVSAVGGRSLPRLRTLRIEINRNGRLEDTGLPTCAVTNILTATSERALSVCRRALVGSGSFQVDVALKGQPSYPTTGRLLLFNGRKGGKPVLFGHVYSSRPFATSFVITFAIAHRGHGRFGTVLTASLPEALGNWGYVTGLEIKLSRRYTYAGRQRSYLSAGCPAPKGFTQVSFPLLKASLGFDGGLDLTSALTRVCRARP